MAVIDPAVGTLYEAAHGAPARHREKPSSRDLREAKLVAALPPEIRRAHQSAVPADRSRLAHINTYGPLPDYYIDKPFRCRDCGKEEIWRAADQKWYFEEAKAHIDAHAVRRHACRTLRNHPAA